MSAADVARVREEVLDRIRREHYPPELSLEGIVADTLLDVLKPEDTLEPFDITDEHRLIKHLVTKALEGRRCEVCHGELIGREIAFGSCGHCGGRSINPTPARGARA